MTAISNNIFQPYKLSKADSLMLGTFVAGLKARMADMDFDIIKR